jgi:hypothetical protein
MHCTLVTVFVSSPLPSTVGLTLRLLYVVVNDKTQLGPAGGVLSNQFSCVQKKTKNCWPYNE